MWFDLGGDASLVVGVVTVRAVTVNKAQGKRCLLSYVLVKF